LDPHPPELSLRQVELPRSKLIRWRPSPPLNSMTSLISARSVGGDAKTRVFGGEKRIWHKSSGRRRHGVGIQVWHAQDSGARWCSFDRFPALVVGRCSPDASLRLGWPAPSGRGISKCLDRTRLRDYQALGGYADVSPGVAIRASYANVPGHFGFVYGPIGTGRSRPAAAAGGFCVLRNHPSFCLQTDTTCLTA